MQVLFSADNYNPQSSANHRLVLALDEKACAYAVHSDEGALQLLGYYEFHTPLKDDETIFFDFIRSQENLKHKYKSTKIVLQGYKSTLVPNALYNDLYIESYLRHQHAVDKNEVVKPVKLFSGEAILVFAAKEYLFYPARSKYYDAEIEPRAAAYLRKCARYHASRLNVFVEQGRIYLVSCLANAPIYFNSFPFATVDEAAYYILNYYQVFSIPVQTMPVLLHGEVHPQLAEILRSYTGKDEIAPIRNRGIKVPDNFDFDFLIDFCH